MPQEQQKSPFSALTFSEQQDRWRAWRSQHLSYQDTRRPQERAPEPPLMQEALRTPAREPPYRHAQLDAVTKKHLQARKQAMKWENV